MFIFFNLMLRSTKQPLILKTINTTLHLQTTTTKIVKQVLNSDEL